MWVKRDIFVNKQREWHQIIKNLMKEKCIKIESEYFGDTSQKRKSEYSAKSKEISTTI